MSPQGTSHDATHRYVTPDEDSARWHHLRLRPGDIVVSSRSKHGTTWLQTILLLLVHGRPQLPAPLAQLSPWLDHRVEPIADVTNRLAGQPGRRVIKTHTPLDGVPFRSNVAYIVIARHPLDAAVSLYHQSHNIDRRRLADLTGIRVAHTQRPPVDDWLRSWISDDREPRTDLDSLPGVLFHLADAWSRRSNPNVTLVHYADLLRDLPQQMRWLARSLDITVDDDALPSLADAARFDHMRAHAIDFVPDRHGVLRDPAAFFRAGTSGAAAALLTPDDLATYARRVDAALPTDLTAWLHR